MAGGIPFKHVCVTGGAGFVGSNLAVLLRGAFAGLEVTALDSLKRRGSELNIERLQSHGVTFTHGDVRCPEDLEALPAFDLLIDCSAEPSVQAGVGEAPVYVLNTNLVGTINCLEAARLRKAAFLFLSTSRVYPIGALNALAFSEEPTRFAWSAQQDVPGCSENGITEEFPLDGARSLYGAGKLAGELILQEYAYNYDMPALINRCGILAGPWQMGKVDQGVVTLWVARHHFGKPLQYIGFGGGGKQVRDMLHIDDLFDLLVRQAGALEQWDGAVYNVGGGLGLSASLLELTGKCRDLTGNTIPIDAQPETSPVDIRIYLTDAQRVQRAFGWQPKRGIDEILADIHTWIRQNEDLVLPILG